MRKIDLIVIHCSATRCNQDFPVEALEACHRERGFNGIGYHYYITRDVPRQYREPTPENTMPTVSVSVTRVDWMRKADPPTPALPPRSVPLRHCSAVCVPTIQPQRSSVTVTSPESGSPVPVSMRGVSIRTSDKSSLWLSE